MRQLQIRVPQGCGKEVVQIAQGYDASNLIQFEAKDSEGPVDVVFLHVSNREVEGLLEELESIENLAVTLIPRGMMPLHPPSSEAPEQVTEVQERSAIEIFLGGLQSVGSWRGFLGYAALAGIVVWIGLFTNSSFLLIAAMLIAPLAGPAMNVAIATARGDKKLLQRSLVRYFSALAVLIAVAAFLSLIMQQEIATPFMVENSQISSVAILLPLAAGTAGALNLVQSERSSLVAGASVGMLVAASLSPPAGIIGMSIPLGRWDMIVNGLFLLLLQLFGINLSAAIIFRVFGLRPRGARYDRGTKKLFPISMGLTTAGLVALLMWQFSDSPNFQRPSRAQRINAEIKEVVESSDLADLVEGNVRFTRPNISGQNTLLAVVYVQRQEGVDLSTEEIRSRLTQEIQTHILQEDFEVTPLVSVTVLETPEFLGDLR
ncbi:TIGR00341 family protein [Laspinema sp. D1]|uniref:TIGR00341 family protein n=1 Tax=Laspinema palackyanum D2a TaxID=2953684 RepID=A0ABT2N1N0_9CYAN|nr:TIGR00341 family protein [Laspinema sp. D2a]